MKYLALIPILLLIGMPLASAEPVVHIDRQQIGRELTVKVTSYNEEYRGGKYLESDVNVKISKYGHILDDKDCTTSKRNGYCTLPFKLTHGKYDAGQYNVTITVDDYIIEKSVWLWKKGY